jgi:hypothetical protein
MTGFFTIGTAIALLTGEPEEPKQQGEAVHNHEEQELNAQQL